MVTGLARGFGQGVGFSARLSWSAGDLWRRCQSSGASRATKIPCAINGAMTAGQGLHRAEDARGGWNLHHRNPSMARCRQARPSCPVDSDRSLAAPSAKSRWRGSRLAATKSRKSHSIYGDAQEEAKRTGKGSATVLKVATGAIVAAAIDNSSRQVRGLDSVAKEGFGRQHRGPTGEVYGLLQMGVQGGTEMARLKVPEEWGRWQRPVPQGHRQGIHQRRRGRSVASGGPGVVGAARAAIRTMWPRAHWLAARCRRIARGIGEAAKPQSELLMRPMERLKSANDRLDDFAATHGIPTKSR